ncbi:hypothetical protein GPA19_17880 [Azoarcus indigens]|uniref:Virion coat protein B n=1 Tax=Azoarcus indigens TaxID=29545 RepID=A0A4R6DPT1_9RHOO|nr:major capsid protein [Azoarcus indigens]NMG66812.1 hypothetical protein [Azoarcus indigens]TDN46980.1 virion coat protein B [Azoarcus indigens]
MQMTRNVVRKYGAKLAAVPALVTLGIGNALAEVPTEVTEGIATAKADAMTIGGAVIGVIIAIVAFFWLRRVLK